MKTLIPILTFFFFCPTTFFAQVGIGNTNPQATVDISASSLTTPTNEDGILIPRIEEFPASNPTAAQDGMLVFVTGNGTPTEGFYYWDNGTTSWLLVNGSGEDLDWREIGTSSPPDNINDNIYTLGNVKIGSATAVSDRLHVNNPVDETFSGLRIISSGDDSGSIAYGVYNQASIGDVLRFSNNYNSITGSSDATIRLIENQISNSGAGTKTALYNEFNFDAPEGSKFGVQNRFEGGDSNVTGVYTQAPPAWSVDGTLIGVDNDLDASGNGIRYGVRTTINGSGTGIKYGSYNLINSSAGGTHYGVYSNVENASGYAGYFRGRFSLGVTGINRYLMPETDGTAGQVMTTDGAGQLSFTTLSTASEWTDAGSYIYPTDGTSEAVLIGTTTYSTGKLQVASLANNAGVEVDFNGPADYGIYTTRDGTTSGVKYGLYNDIAGSSGNYSVWGTHNNITTDGNGSRIAIYNTVNSTGTGNKFATWNYIPSGNPGTHYGIYSDAQNASGYAGYFVGRMSLGNSAINRYIMPASDGTTGQVMTTDGAGNVSFQNPSGGDSDWYEVGTSNAPNAITDNMYTEGHLAIGSNATNGSYNIDSSSSSGGVEVLIGAEATGIPAIEVNASGVGNDGIYINLTSTSNTDDRSAIYAQSPILNTTSRMNFLNSAPGNTMYGLRNDVTLTGTTIDFEGVTNFISGTSTNVAHSPTGVYNFVMADISGQSYGIHNRFLGGGNGTKYGTYNYFGNSSSGVQFGSYTVYSTNTSSFAKYGYYANIPNGNGGTHYGFYADVTKSGSYAAYFLGNVSIGTNTSNEYILPASRGTNGQVMQTDGAGNVSWTNPAFSEWTDGGTFLYPSDGTTEDVVIGQNTSGTGRLTIDAGTKNASIVTSRTTTTSSFHFGLSNYISNDNGGGASAGVNNLIEGTGGSNLRFGTRTVINGSSSPTFVSHYGVYNEINTSGTGFRYGSYNLISGSATGASTKYGTYNEISSSAGGTHYGTYNEVDVSSGWAGYFLGRNYISERLSIGETNNANAFLNIRGNSDGTISHIELEQTTADTGARIRFKNASETANEWILFGRTDDTSSESRFNIFHNGTGNIIQVRGSGQVGINDSDPTHALELPNNTDPTIGRGRANAWITYSDSRVKKDQQELRYGLSEILQITPKSYLQFASEFENGSLMLKEGTGTKEIGFIAQELMQIIPEATYQPENENEDLWSVDYEKIIPVAVNAIKELNTKVENLASENEQLKQQLQQYKSLEARISALEGKDTPQTSETANLTEEK